MKIYPVELNWDGWIGHALEAKQYWRYLTNWKEIPCNTYKTINLIMCSEGWSSNTRQQYIYKKSVVQMRILRYRLLKVIQWLIGCKEWLDDAKRDEVDIKFHEGKLT